LSQARSLGLPSPAPYQMLDLALADVGCTAFVKKPRPTVTPG
jgi:hypothetical protein